MRHWSLEPHIKADYTHCGAHSTQHIHLYKYTRSGVGFGYTGFVPPYSGIHLDSSQFRISIIEAHTVCYTPLFAAPTFLTSGVGTRGVVIGDECYGRRGNRQVQPALPRWTGMSQHYALLIRHFITARIVSPQYLPYQSLECKEG
jgi:hypothetical protein